MKKLTLLIFVFTSLIAFSQPTKRNLINGTWVSDATEYTLVVTTPNNWNRFKFLNYRPKVYYHRDGAGVFVFKAEEEMIPAHHQKHKYKIETKVDRSVLTHKKGKFRVVYENINKNKLKATIKDEYGCEEVLYYTKKITNIK